MSQHLISANIKIFASSVETGVAAASEQGAEARSRCARAEAQYVAARSASPGIGAQRLGERGMWAGDAVTSLQGSFDLHRRAPLP